MTGYHAQKLMRLGFVALLTANWTCRPFSYPAAAAETTCQICDRCPVSSGGKALQKNTLEKLLARQHSSAECHAACLNCYIRGVIGRPDAVKPSGKIKTPMPLLPGKRSEN